MFNLFIQPNWPRNEIVWVNEFPIIIMFFSSLSLDILLLFITVYNNFQKEEVNKINNHLKCLACTEIHTYICTIINGALYGGIISIKAFYSRCLNILLIFSLLWNIILVYRISGEWQFIQTWYKSSHISFYQNSH